MRNPPSTFSQSASWEAKEIEFGKRREEGQHSLGCRTKANFTSGRRHPDTENTGDILLLVRGIIITPVRWVTTLNAPNNAPNKRIAYFDIN